MTYTGYIIKLEPLKGSVSNLGRVKRTLKLINFINNDWKSIKECANYINVHPKSIHRYFNMLVLVGFDVEKRVSRRGGYRITNVTEYFRSNRIEDNVPI